MNIRHYDWFWFAIWLVIIGTVTALAIGAAP